MHFAPFFFFCVLLLLSKCFFVYTKWIEKQAAATLANVLAICFAHQLLAEKQLSLKVVNRPCS